MGCSLACPRLEEYIIIVCDICSGACYELGCPAGALASPAAGGVAMDILSDIFEFWQRA